MSPSSRPVRSRTTHGTTIAPASAAQIPILAIDPRRANAATVPPTDIRERPPWARARRALWSIVGHTSEAMTRLYSDSPYAARAEAADSFTNLLAEAREAAAQGAVVDPLSPSA